MALKGSLRDASLPDVLQLLALGRKTGCLSVADRSELGQIFFQEGSICYASILNRRDRLGDLLVRNGLVTPERLAVAVEAQNARDGRRLGEILVQNGDLTFRQLEQFIRLQIEEAVYYLFTWTRGSFTFEADQGPPEGALLVSLNAESVLLEGARRVDEWSQIAKKISSLDLVFRRDPELSGSVEAELTEEQRRLLPLLDGPRSVHDLVEESGLVEFEVGKALFGLIQVGSIHPVGRRPPSAPAGALAREQEHRNLGVAFYRAGMPEDAVREFRRVLELRPEDLEARFFLGLVALRGGHRRSAVRHFKGVIENGGGWAAAFHDLGLALEGLDRVEEARLCVEEALRIRPRDPRILLSHAILLCKTGRMPEAAEAFRRHRDVAPGPPGAAFFAFAGLAEAACGRTEEALRLLDEGLALHPECAPLMLHAGTVRERTGAWDEAEALYLRAAELEPGMAAAHKSLGDALYRRGELDAAARSFEAALRLAPGRGPDAPFKLGNIRLKGGEPEEAARLWREALRIDPEHPQARRNLEAVERVAGGARA